MTGHATMEPSGTTVRARASSRRRGLPVLVAVCLVAACGDDDDDADEAGSSVTAPATEAGATDATTAESPTSGAPTTGAAPTDAIDPLSATVEVTGSPLAPLSLGGMPDPAVGNPPPALAGTTYAGEALEFTPGDAGDTMLVFLAHWNPDSDDVIPALLEWRDAGATSAEVDVIGVSSGVREGLPNYPPADWLAASGWAWPTLADSPSTDTSSGAAADAYGLSEYPFFTIVGADGTVKLRASGPKTPDEIEALVTEALER